MVFLRSATISTPVPRLRTTGRLDSRQDFRMRLRDEEPLHGWRATSASAVTVKQAWSKHGEIMVHSCDESGQRANTILNEVVLNGSNVAGAPEGVVGVETHARTRRWNIRTDFWLCPPELANFQAPPWDTR
eukprot:s1426_g18.t1